MKTWVHVYMCAMFILLSFCLLIVVGWLHQMELHIAQLQYTIEVIGEECKQTRADMEKWERLNDTSIRLLAEGGWEWLK